jgi:hypothetical protein
MELYATVATLFGLAMLLLTTRELARRKIGLLQYSLWMILWIALVLVGTFPQFYSALLFATEALGMYTPIHFVTTFSILALFAVAYYLGKRITELDDKLSTVVQHIALQTSSVKALEPGKEKEKLPESKRSI